MLVVDNVRKHHCPNQRKERKQNWNSSGHNTSVATKTVKKMPRAKRFINAVVSVQCDCDTSGCQLASLSFLTAFGRQMLNN